MARNKPNTPPESASAPAAETTQQEAAAGETQPSTDKPDPVVVALLVSAKTDGFRRAGRSWSKEQTRVEIADLHDGDAEALFAEPMLDVVGVAE